MSPAKFEVRVTNCHELLRIFDICEGITLVLPGGRIKRLDELCWRRGRGVTLYFTDGHGVGGTTMAELKAVEEIAQD